jgi:hypothetical protein
MMGPVADRLARSRADLELAAYVASQGGHASPWQIERWRQAGLIPSAKRVGAGRGKGSVATYSNEARNRAVLVAARVKHRRALGDVALELFVEGEAVPLDAIRRALLTHVDALERWVGPAKTQQGMLNVAEARAKQLMHVAARTRNGRAMRRRLSTLGDPADGVLWSVLTQFLIILQGGYVSDEGLRELFVASGMVRLLPGGNGQPAAEGVLMPVGTAEFFRKMSLPAMRRRAASITEEELKGARELLALMIPFAAAITTLAQAFLGEKDPFSLSQFGQLATGDMTWMGLMVATALEDESRQDGQADPLGRLRQLVPLLTAGAAAVAAIRSSTWAALRHHGAQHLELRDDERRSLQTVGVAVKALGGEESAD